MKNKFMISAILLTILLLTFTGLMARDNDGRIISGVNDGVILQKDGLYHKLHVRTRADGSRSVVDTLFYYAPPTAPEAYDDFLAGYQGTGTDPADTCVNWFTLLAPGTVNKIFMQNVTSGTANMYIWSPATVYVPDSAAWYYNFPDDEVNMLMPFSVPLSCSAQDPATQFTGGVWTPTWNMLDLVATFGAGVSVDGVNDSLDIWVGYAMDGTGNPTIWQDGTFHDPDLDGTCRSFSTLHAICPTIYGCWYRIISTADDRLWVAHMMQIEVEYESVPPFIENISHFSNTFDGNKVVRAEITDLEGDAFTATMRYRIGLNGTVTDVPMTNTEGDWYEAALTASPGDTVYYGIIATDTTGLENSVGYYHFIVYEPPADTPILLVNSNGYDNDSLYTLALDNLGQAYYTWNMSEEGGIDASVINYDGFSLIFVFGWGTDVVPVTDQEDLYGVADYLNSGRSLVLADMDWFFHNDLPATGTFVAGDFAYDYFGLGNYSNDPVDAGGASAADVEMLGITGDPITDPFSTSPYGPIDYEAVGWANWGDFSYPNSEGTAVTIFNGSTNGESMAVFNNNGYKTVYFSFSPELVTASEFSEFETLLDNLIQAVGICVKGDVNNDGLINVSDIVKTVRYILELETPDDWGACAADMNGDGNINVTDIVQIVNVILGSAPRTAASYVGFDMTEGSLRINSDGEIGGLQFKVNGEVDVTATQGVEAHYRTVDGVTTVVIYSLEGSLPLNKTLVNFDHPVELIGEPIAADRQGNELPVEIEVAETFSLFQNYPNPFNPTTTISYNLPEASSVKLSIYNILGEKVVELVNDYQSAGIHTIQWNGTDNHGKVLSSGLYFYQIKAGEFSAMKKMFFIK